MPDVVLCIDDEPSILNLHSMVLVAAGYEAITAPTGADGLRFFTSRPVDAVLLDYTLPDLTGAAVARMMKNLRPSVPILMMSGHDSVPVDADPWIDAFVPKGVASQTWLARLGALAQARPLVRRDEIVYDGTPTILCIDAKPDALDAWERSLCAAGFAVIATTSGAEGLDIFCKSSPDLVVIDLKSRDVHGAEVARRIRARSPKVPIILLCGSYWWPPEAVLHSVNALVIKGDGGPALVAKVRELLLHPGEPSSVVEAERARSATSAA